MFVFVWPPAYRPSHQWVLVENLFRDGISMDFSFKPRCVAPFWETDAPSFGVARLSRPVYPARGDRGSTGRLSRNTHSKWLRAEGDGRGMDGVLAWVWPS